MGGVDRGGGAAGAVIAGEVNYLVTIFNSSFVWSASFLMRIKNDGFGVNRVEVAFLFQGEGLMI
jgi:hypothetical protein